MLSLLVSILALGEAGASVVPFEVLSLADSSVCDELSQGATPRVVRLSSGLATARDDGTFTYACGADWGGEAPTAAASSPDGLQLLVVSPGGAFFSATGACGATPLDLGGGIPVEVVYWRAAFWVVQRDLEAGESRLHRTDGEITTTVAVWDSFHPDAAAVEGNDKLWLAGVSPEPQVRRLGLVGGLTGNQPLASLPADIRDIERLEPMAARDGEAWIRVSRRQSQWTWHAEALPNDEVRWTDTVERPRTWLGPVWHEGRWLAAADLQLRVSAPGDRSWGDGGGRVSWTCLSNIGERSFACTTESLLLLEGDEPTETPVFHVSQIRGPDDICSPSSACLDDWVDALETLDRSSEDEPAACPDGRTPTDLNGQECGCDSGGSGGWLWWLLLYGHVRTRGSSSSQSPWRGT